MLAPRVDRRLAEGNVERLVPKDRLDEVADGYNAERRDEALAQRFQFRDAPIAPAPTAPARVAQGTDDPTALVDRLLTAAASGDTAAFRDATRTAADHDAARALRDHAVTTVDQQQAAVQQQATQQQDMQQNEAPVRRHTMPMH